MREIKFRAWDTDHQKMLTGFDIFKECYCDVIMDHSKDSIKWMQFTGLKDKHGKEIYEGDILLVRELHDGDDNAWQQPCGPAIPCQVTWDEQYKQFDFGGCSRVIFQPYHFEVIGNVYEHPDLLKGE